MLLATNLPQRYKKNLTYTRISSRKTLRELIFHPKTTPNVTEKMTDNVTERRHWEMQFCNDAIDELAIRLP